MLVELPSLTHSHWLAANREAVGERAWPDSDIHVAIERVIEAIVGTKLAHPPSPSVGTAKENLSDVGWVNTAGLDAALFHTRAKILTSIFM